MKIIKSILLVVSVFLAQQSFASPFYYTVGAINMKIEQNIPGQTILVPVSATQSIAFTNADTNFSAKAYVVTVGVGAKINDNFSAEVRYGKSLSDSDYSGTNHLPSKLRIRNFLSAALIGKVQLSGDFEVFGKLGMASIDEVTEFTTTTAFANSGDIAENDRFDFSYGVGVKYKISDTNAVRLEYDNYHDSTIDFTNGTIEASGFGVYYESDF